MTDLRGSRSLTGKLGKLKRKLLEFREEFFDPALRDPGRRRAIEFLRKNRVEAVLAEPGPSGCMIRTVCKAAEIPLYVHFHGRDAIVRGQSRRWQWHYKTLFRDASGVIVPSNYLRHAILGLGCPAQKIHVSPNGVDPAPFKAADHEVGRLLAVSRLVDVKGPLFTINAFKEVLKRHPESMLDFVGDGPLMEDCKALAKRLGIEDRIVFHGALEHSKTLSLFKLASVFVQHSVKDFDGAEESFGITFVEAAFSGIPVVATRSGGIPEVVVDKETGLLVEQGDHVAMAAAISSLLDSPTEAKAMGERGRSRALARFTMTESSARLRRLMGVAEPVRHV
ncbi:MAG: glycosyltransferase [Pseudomonadota bacterium]